MAVRVLDPTEYGKLEKDLETALPVSLCAYNHFKLLRRGLLTDKTVLVDSWPEFSAVVIVDGKKKETAARAIGFCKDPDFCQALEKLLRHAFTVLASPLIIAGCTEDVMDSLVNLIKSAESSPIKKACRTTYVYTFPSDMILPLKIPDGFKLSELQQTHVENVRNAWPYRDEFEQYTDLRQWIRYHFDNFPTVCIETEDGRPVAWEFQQEYGAVGMLHVEPEYRRLKLGSVVTRILAQKLVKDGQLVFACVDDRNETSVTFHEKNGYIRLPFKYSFAVYHL
ncbi:glycine N-acyltransferase-like [Saccostrea echinata]|uniref:glycine N-acyltransferase-like n=1 Tax=Saccostrea echinata TaxID=191078 RepID=UPI002A818BD3|nr:glycine N-acyltransferase-like [Saccostrea echinata]